MSTSIAFDLIAKNNASPAFDKVGKSADGAGGKLGKAGDMAEKSGGKFSKMGKLAAGAGAAVAAAALVVGKGLMSAMDNEKVNDRLAASLGATPKLAEKYGKAASHLYAGAWGESMDDVSHAVEAVASSFKGLGAGKHLEKVTAQAMDFATIFEIDVPRAVSVAQTMIHSKLAKNATQALDLLTTAAQRVPAALRPDLLDATNEYGQFFNTIGMNGSQTMAILVAASKKGEFGIDKIGDAVKEFTIRSTDMSTSSKAAYKIMGLDAGRMANLMLAGGKKAGAATQAVVTGLLKIKDPAKQANAAIALFGTPIEDLNVKDIPAFLRSLDTGAKGLGKFRGAIDKAGATLNDNASTKIEGYKRAISTTFVNVLGSKVLPALEKFGGYVATNLGPTLSELGRAWLRGAQMMGSFYMMIGQKVAPTVRQLGGWIKTELMPPLRELGNAVLTGVQKAMRNARGSGEDLKPTLKALGVVAKLLGKYLTDFVIPAWTKFATHVLPHVGTAIRIAASSIGGFVKSVQVGTGLVKAAFGSTREKISAVVGFIREVPSKIKGAFAGAGTWLSSAGKAVIQGFIDGIQSKVKPLTDALGYITSLVPKHKGPIDKDRILLQPAGVAIMEGLIKGIESRKQRLTTVLTKITDFVRKQGEKVRGVMSDKRSFVDSFKSSFAGSSVFGSEATDIGSILAFQQQKAAGASSLRANIAALIKKGVSKSVLNQLSSGGDSGLAQIQALASASSGQVAAFNKLVAATDKDTAAAGSLAGGRMYDKEIAAAKRDQRLAIAIAREMRKMMRAQDRDTVVEVILDGRVIRRSLLELKRKSGSNLGLT